MLDLSDDLKHFKEANAPNYTDDTRLLSGCLNLK